MSRGKLIVVFRIEMHKEQLVAAVKAVGVSANAVKKYLGK